METIKYTQLRAYASRLCKQIVQATAQKNTDGSISSKCPSVLSVMDSVRMLECRDDGKTVVMPDDWREQMKRYAKEYILANSVMNEPGSDIRTIRM